MSSHGQIKLLNILASIIGMSSVVLSVLLVVFVNSQFSDIHPESIEASKQFQDESLNIWKTLRAVDINPNLLRNRREAPAKPSPPAEPQTFSYGIPTERFGGYYAPPKSSVDQSYDVPSPSKSTTNYEHDMVVDGYDVPTTASYGPPAAISSYAGSFEEANADEPRFEFQWEGIKPPTCNCKSDNQCPPGPPGPKGLSGENGQPGEDGKPGDRGKVADDVLPITPPINHCIMCPQGEPGPPGVQGKKGSRGLRGARGGDGSGGRAGQPGTPGQHGPEGEPGPDGEAGFTGAPGMDAHALVGIPGPKGILGEVGESGLPGDCGLDGQIGLVGVPGTRGGDGLAGHKGAEGARGIEGVEGDPGQDAEYCPCPRNRQYDNAANRLLRV